MRLSDYILTPKEARTAHIDLSTECVIAGVPSRAQILDYFGIEDDVERWRDARIHRCHLCQHHSQNGWCSNPQHIYIGTASENAADKDPSATCAPKQTTVFDAITSEWITAPSRTQLAEVLGCHVVSVIRLLTGKASSVKLRYFRDIPSETALETARSIYTP